MGHMKKNRFKSDPLPLALLLLVLLIPFPAVASEKVYRNSLGMEFIRIPAGSFVMGSPENEPQRHSGEVQHAVTITRPFFLQTTEVTLKQWRALMGKRLFGRRKGPADLPVVRISWHDCMDFIKKLNLLGEGTYRLPTEAEWEYACRAGSTTAYNWGNDIGCSKAMYGNKRLKSDECLEYHRSVGQKRNCPAPVKSYQANAWGLFDMHGNVWEWCQDWFGDYPGTSAMDPLGPDSGPGKVRRGGGWSSDGGSCRCANRAFGRPPTKYRTTGFRVVRNVP